MKWLRKWAYPLLFLGSGLIYFTFVEHWQAYGGAVQDFMSWYQELREEDGSGRMRDAALAGAEILGKASCGEAGSVLWPESSGDGSGQEGMGEEHGQDGSGDGSVQDDPQTDPGQDKADQSDPEEPKPVEYMTVDDDYFADAVFIGDSRTVGMFEYGGLEEISTFYASKGLTIYKLFDSAVAPSPEGKITIEEALQQNQFAKIYLMIGINEMGTGTLEGFLEKYGEAVTHLRELQPEAIIYLQGIMKVTSERSAKGDYINNEGIEARNEGIALLADDEKVFFLDMNSMVCDDTGGLDPQYTYDGVHLKGKDIQIWKDYLKTHAISP